MKSLRTASLWAGAGMAVAVAYAAGVGYDDTPLIPGQKWRVHDKNRPNPPVVTPASAFSHMAGAPSDAVVLFDGTDLSHWKSGNGDARWKVENGYMEVTRGGGGIETRDRFSDFQLHIEWSAPNPPRGESQGRGNSGVFLHGRYEVQVLDSHENVTYADGQAGSMYGQWPPMANAMAKPGEWNSYDIIFEGPKWDESGELVKKANVTVIHNGVVLHHKQEYNGPSGHRNTPGYSRYDGMGPISLQDHGDPVRFRNIWIRPLGTYDRPESH